MRTRLRYNGLEYTQFTGDLTAEYFPCFLENSEKILRKLTELPWSKVEYPMYGKTRVTPRLTWCFGRLDDKVVKYRGKKFLTEEFPDWLAELRDKVCSITCFKANACILNYYQSSSDHINWHADDEKFLAETTVASISLNEELVFSMRNKDFRYDICLRDGSLLMMYDGIEHCLDSQPNSKGRYNITFRRLNSEKGMGNYYYYNRGSRYSL
jgi:alkylated DNA repair dioxygenase AlkB